MVRFSNKNLEDILLFAAGLDGSRQHIASMLKSVYLKLGDDARGTEFKNELASRLENQVISQMAPRLTWDDWAKASVAIDDPSLTHAVAKAMSPDNRKKYFPGLISKFETIDEMGVPAAGATGATNTSGTAPFIVPIGSTSPAIEKKKKKSR